MLRLAAFIVLFVFCSAAYAQDPVQTDGDKYKILLENDRVRASFAGS
jgi:hypothetical protein